MYPVYILYPVDIPLYSVDKNDNQKLSMTGISAKKKRQWQPDVFQKSFPLPADQYHFHHHTASLHHDEDSPPNHSSSGHDVLGDVFPKDPPGDVPRGQRVRGQRHGARHSPAGSDGLRWEGAAGRARVHPASHR